MDNDPLDKLISYDPIPPLPNTKHKAPRKRKNRPPSFAPVGKCFVLGPRQAAIVEKQSKAIGFSQYMRNLIRADVEADGLTWPDEVKPRELG